MTDPRALNPDALEAAIEAAADYHRRAQSAPGMASIHDQYATAIRTYLEHKDDEPPAHPPWSDEVEMTLPWNGDRYNEDDVCSWPGCGSTGEDEGWPSFIYITVLVSPGEEGYAEVTQALCPEHFEHVAAGLMVLGFKSHNHHGTNLLDAEADCGGYGECLTPADYGPELVR